MTFWDIVITIACGFAVNECCEISPWAAKKLVRWSAFLRYRDSSRAAIRAEELSALIDARPGKLFKLITALWFAASALRVAGERAVADLSARIALATDSGQSMVTLKTATSLIVVATLASVTAIYFLDQNTVAPYDSEGYLVAGRASEPTDIGAPGIQMPANSQLSVGINGKQVLLSGQNWDTITSQSAVARLVSVSYGRDLNHSGTTDNRFQYLADRIYECFIPSSLPSSLDPIDVVQGIDHGRLVAIAALYNPTNTAWKLNGLDIAVSTNKPVRKFIAVGKFISRSILLPPKTIYFIRLVFSRYRDIPTLHNQIMMTTSFNWYGHQLT